MPPTPEARALAPEKMDPEDVQNYMEQLDCLKTYLVPQNTRILNIQQLFDADWEYKGSWFHCDHNCSGPMFWVWMNEDWDSERFDDSPVQMFKYIHDMTGLIEPNYRVYGNFGGWTLCSAGSLTYASFVE